MAKINQAMQDLLRYNAAILPQKRSTFNKSHSHTTTFDSAYLIPLMYDRVVPGDEKKIRYSGLARMATPKVPVMDEAKLDVWAFYVPDRLWWSNAKSFYGENLDAEFNPDGEYQMPFLKPSQYMVDPTSGDGTDRVIGLHSLNDYFGFPVGVRGYLGNIDNLDEFKVMAGLHRCYQLIWNNYFRNTSVQPALRLNTGDTVTDEEWDIIKHIRKVCKYPDFFTTLLRSPQAGADVLLPLGDKAPVVATKDIVDPNLQDSQLLMKSLFTPTDGRDHWYENPAFYGSLFNTPNGTIKTAYDSSIVTETGSLLTPVNLWADLTEATSATINNLRAAITIQQLLELDGMAGKFYHTILEAHFGVFTPDATLQRPELLGATRTNIGMRQVLQTSATGDGTTPQGNTAAFSLTSLDNEWICNKAFTEPGFILVLGAVRPVHSYSQGIDPLLTKLNRYDHFYPVFDNLGNQPVPTTAIYASVNPTHSDGHTFPAEDYLNVFGYQEAWTEYRIRQNRVSGLMRADIGEVDANNPNGQHNSMAVWNYSSNFVEPPILNSDFVTEDEELMDRSIAVSSEPQFILDSYFDYLDTKNMSVHSIPGLLRL